MLIKRQSHIAATHDYESIHLCSTQNVWLNQIFSATHDAHEHTRWLLHQNWEMIKHILRWNWWVPASITMLTLNSSRFLIYSALGLLQVRLAVVLACLSTPSSPPKKKGNTHTLSRVGGRRGSVSISGCMHGVCCASLSPENLPTILWFQRCFHGSFSNANTWQIFTFIFCPM